ncbi:MAG: EAL domain-containing protein [Gammaproteobacteria bacterium]|nr:EAL domain-containing protein [Gammaproteobacteria bacterium]
MSSQDKLDISITTGAHPALDPAHRNSAGIDPLLAKVAIDLQTLKADDRDQVIAESIENLRDATGVDSICVALYGSDSRRVFRVIEASHPTSDCWAVGVSGTDIDDLPWLGSRLSPLRLVEILDSRYLEPEQAAEQNWLTQLRIRSMIAMSFDVGGSPAGFISLLWDKPRSMPDANLGLLLKLVATSLATGLERLHMRHSLEHVREQVELATFGANDGMWDWDVKAGTIYFSPRWKSMLGYGEDDLIDSMPHWRDLIHPDDLPEVQSLFRKHLRGDTSLFESTHRLRRKDGDWRWVLSRAKAINNERSVLRRVVGVELDITERKLYEQALFREKESAQTTLESIGDGVITTDSDGIVEYLNPVAEELTGWNMEDAAGRPIDEIFRGFHEETCEPLENPMSVAIRRHRPVKSVRPTLLIRRNGDEIYIESTASPIRDGEGRLAGGVLVFHDVSESRELNRRLSYHASHDVLTGLVNRREFEDRLERVLKSAKANEGAYALCYLDLDQFKIINDTCGHAAGDALLGQLGALLKSKIRWRDTLARLGGDEFGVLLENCTLEEAMRNAEVLRETIQEFRFNWDDRAFRLATSIGVVPITADNDDVAGLLNAADSACAAAKEAGRNRIHCFHENDIELLRRRREIQWAARINNALDESRFELFRQVIQPLQATDDGVHYELLLRMRDENGGLISPGIFISAAERYGIIPSIDRWVIENSFNWLISAADERERLELCSINLSGQSLGDEKFLPFVIDQFKNTGLDPQKICFEITETAAIASYSQANRFIQALKELGCLFALDDFGTGLSSFGYLKHFPVDFLKIDGSFVKEILHDPIDREMVRSINEIGHLTGKRTIAEFAENIEIIEMLTRMGIDYAQGFGVSEPEHILRAVA